MMLTRLTFVRAAQGAFLLAGLMAAASPAVAQKEWLVHSFPADGSQGNNPVGNLVADSSGNLYGTTTYGGASSFGTVYELVRPVPPKTAWTEVILYSFTAGTDAELPDGGLVFDKAGNLYGTASQLGTGVAFGVVYKLSPPATAGSPWTNSVLYTFSGAQSGDGANPRGELIRDEAGNLYGVTSAGSTKQNTGCRPGCGTVFQLSPPAKPGGVWTEAILHSFSYLQGANPYAGPVFDSQGNLYGTTELGGEFHNGVVYRLLRPTTAGGTWTYKVLYAFGPRTVGSAEGASPLSVLTLRGNRVLYGTTVGGGLNGDGTVFQLLPPTVANGPWTENILHSFGSGASDGGYPISNVVFDSTGNIYGTTQNGGDGSLAAGILFELTPPASDGPWTETILHSFNTEGKDGARPSDLIFGKNGVLFGATEFGGTGKVGAVFGLLP